MLIWSQPLEEEASVFISVLHKVELRLTNLSRVTQLELEPSSFVQTRSELDPPPPGWMEARGFQWAGMAISPWEEVGAVPVLSGLFFEAENRLVLPETSRDVQK